MKILLIHVGGAADGGLAESLEEFGHAVRVVSRAADVARAGKGFEPDAVVVRLESDAAAGLDVAHSVVSGPSCAGVPVLVTGTNEIALEAARRRLPDASFVRPDHVMTALASIEADE